MNPKARPHILRRVVLSVALLISALGGLLLGTPILPPPRAAQASGAPPVSGMEDLTFAAGDAHSCAITAAGALRCWGRNDYGQVGNGSTSGSFNSPQSVSGLTSGVSAVSAGGGVFWNGSSWQYQAHTCAIHNGALRCWGANGFGQVGNGSTGGSFNSPQPVSGLTSGVSAVSAGGSHTCAVQNGAL